MYYGILKTSSSTGADNEILLKFTTPINIISNQPVFVSDTVMLRRVVQSQNVQRWELEAGIEPTRGSAEFLQHSLNAGYHSNIYIRMPQMFREIEPSGSATATGSLASSLITVTPTNLSGVVVGEFISFANHSKVYVITAMVFANNVWTYTISPRLKMAVSNTAINFGGKVVLTAKYDPTSQIGIKYNNGVLADPGSIKFIEAI